MTETTAPTAPEREDGAVRRFFTGRSHFDFVSRSRTWLIVSIILVLISLAAIYARGLNFSLDFTGGTAYTVTGATEDFTAEELQAALEEVGVTESIVQIVDDGAGALISTPALGEVGGADQDAVTAAIEEVTGADSETIDITSVGPRWGQQISRQALRGLLVFLVLVALYLTLRFEWRMAAAALVTLAHDIVVSVGLYALLGFKISPASVIAFLTILGYSLYDTVIVFDRVREDTGTLSSVSTVTYGETANKALNEVLVRSLSTALTAILPVASLLFIGAQLLGAETLEDLALALFIGMAVGTYSSIFVATPFLVWLKEREPRWAELKTKVNARRGSGEPAAATASAAPAPATTPAAAAPSGSQPKAKQQPARRKPRRR